MRIWAQDILPIKDLLEKELAIGNTWLAYNTALGYAKKDELYFFKNENEAEDFCISNISENDRFSGTEIKPLLDTINKILSKPKGLSTHYELDEENQIYTLYRSNSLEINPDQNPLFNPDGNSFTDAIIDHWEQQQLQRSILIDRKVNAENIGQLTDKIISIGIVDNDIAGRLKESISEGSQRFQLSTIQEFGEDKVAFRIFFKQMPDDLYAIAGYNAILYHPVLIEHKEINGVDTRELERQMKNADWNFDRFESLEDWKNAYKEIESITDSLLLISHNDKGALIAIQLWNNHALAGNVEKPGFIERLEGKLDYYPSAEFHPHILVQNAYLALQPKAIENKLSVFPIKELKDQEAKNALIDSLIEGNLVSITLERTLVPANIKGMYAIVERSFPEDSVYETGPSIMRTHSFFSYEEAKDSFTKEAALLPTNPDRCFHELSLVEEFENSKLKFNYEGDPEKNTGLLLERFFAPISVDRPDYSPGIDPYREITVRDIIYVELHSYSKSIDIYDEIGKVKNVDREFWNLKDAGNSIMEKPELVQLDTIVNNDFKYNKNLSIMNEKNLDYLKNTLKYMGFEDRVNEQLERDIRAGKEESRPVDSKQFNNLQTDSTLHFSKGKENDMYFFNKYDVTVTREDGRSESQTMYINQVKVYNEEKLREETRLSGFTLKEAANLLDGRAVYREFTNKDGEQYKAWKQIDFTQQDDRKNYKYHTFHENYGFNLEKAMDKRNILEANSTEGKDALIKSWQKGNLQAVTIEENGSKERRYLAADPKNRDFIEYDNNFKLIQKEAQEVNLKFKRTDQNVDDKDLKKGGAEKNVSAGIGQENDDSKKKLNKGGKGKNGKEGKDESLLPKNRTAKSKGQGV